MVTSNSFTNASSMLSKSPPQPPTPISSQPPPLPPLPPSLASKYFINKSLNLDLTINTNDHGGKVAPAAPNSAGATDNGASSTLKENFNESLNESKTERHSKSVSEYDTLMKGRSQKSLSRLLKWESTKSCLAFCKT